MIKDMVEEDDVQKKKRGNLGLWAAKLKTLNKIEKNNLGGNHQPRTLENHQPKSLGKVAKRGA